MEICQRSGPTMSKFTIEDILANRVEELEDAHHELFVMFTMYRKVLEDITMVTDTDREDFLKGMTDLAYARKKLSLVRKMAEDVLKDVGASAK